MPGFIIMGASRLSVQTFLLYILPLLFSNNPTFFTNEHYQVSLLKQGYWNHHLLFSVAENKTKVPAFKHNWMLLQLHQVTPSRSIRKQAPHRAITAPIPAPVLLCSTSGTSPCWKKNSARSRCERRYNNRDKSIYTQVVTPGWTPCNVSLTVSWGKRLLYSWNISDILQHVSVPNIVLPQEGQQQG